MLSKVSYWEIFPWVFLLRTFSVVSRSNSPSIIWAPHSKYLATSYIMRALLSWMKLIPLYFSHMAASLFCSFPWAVYSSCWLKLFLSSFILEDRVHLVDFRKQEWLFPETTANFDKLLIQCRGFCPYTFATTDGLLLPGILLEIMLFSLPHFFFE